MGFQADPPRPRSGDELIVWGDSLGVIERLREEVAQLKRENARLRDEADERQAIIAACMREE